MNQEPDFALMATDLIEEIRKMNDNILDLIEELKGIKHAITLLSIDES